MSLEYDEVSVEWSEPVETVLVPAGVYLCRIYCEGLEYTRNAGMPMVKVIGEVLEGEYAGARIEDAFFPSKMTKDGKPNSMSWRLFHALHHAFGIAKTENVTGALIRQTLNGALANVTVVASYYEVPGHTTPDGRGVERPTRYNAEAAEELRSQGERTYARTLVDAAGYEPATDEEVARHGASLEGTWEDVDSALPNGADSGHASK
jgi:hypothetical protein